MARRFKLKHLPEFSQLSGGQAIELAASKATNPLQYNFTIPLQQYKDCNFSISGLKNQILRQLFEDEKKHSKSRTKFNFNEIQYNSRCSS